MKAIGAGAGVRCGQDTEADGGGGEGGRSNPCRVPLTLLRNFVLKAIEPLNTLGEGVMKKTLVCERSL